MESRQKDYHPYIDDYIDKIRNGDIESSKEIKQATDLVERKLNKDNVFIDNEKINKAVELTERYFGYNLLDWELFLFAIIHCYDKKLDMVIFDEFLIVMGRGNGKNGFISPLIWYLTTHYHGVKGYNVDIIANNEEQAKTSFNDVFDVLENTWAKSKIFFQKTKQIIRNIRTKSYIKYNTSNARTKDGKRSACLIFDEIHEYENYDSISVFTSGFGKRKHSRIFYITTNGYVRGGVLDDQLDLAKRVLTGEIDNIGLLPLIYKIDKKEEARDSKKWIKANPSLPYFPELKKEMDKHFIKMKYQHHLKIDFLTKRMNFPVDDVHQEAIPWSKVLETNKPIPYEELKGHQCLGAIDYAMINDFASVGLLFKKDGYRYFIEHTFVCHKALKIESRELKFPVREMADKGLITIVNDEYIKESYIADWFIEKASEYQIIDIVADKFRASFLQDEFKSKGLPLSITRSGPITHSQMAPLLESVFADNKMILGDNPTMRWYINNTAKQVDNKGNTTYVKIEPLTRKTDGFFCLIHALTKDNELEENAEFMDIGIINY